jgi:hypothetical protein
MRMARRSYRLRTYLLPLLLAMALLAAAPARAADPPLPDQALIKLCLDEIASRQSQGETPSEPHIARSKITRGEKQDEVALDLAYAEGRPLSARCIIRGGKIFDYHQ